MKGVTCLSEIGEGSPEVLINGRYQIVRELGCGAMGRVFRARDRLSENADVALKFLLPSCARSSCSFRRFRKEAEVARKFDHPNLIKIHSISVSDTGDLFISMEYVDGVNLSSVIGQASATRSNFAQNMQILYDICQGMAYAHSQGILHRDLKADNVLLSKTGEAKVVDFGLARVIRNDCSLTENGACLGTPYYMSPEQFQGRDLDSRCDIYSFGILAYELLAKEKPFRAKNYYTLAHQHFSQPLPSLSSSGDEFPEWLEELLEYCTEKNRIDRPRRFEEVAGIIETYCPYVASSENKQGSSVFPDKSSRTEVVAANRRRKLKRFVRKYLGRTAAEIVSRVAPILPHSRCKIGVKLAKKSEL